MNPKHPRYQELRESLYRVKAGYAGEKIADKYLARCQFNVPVTILTDVQLLMEKDIRIQLDTLLITPSGLFILEVKNIAGRLICRTNPPHVECQYENRPPIVMECLHMQTENSRQYLQKWLTEEGFEIPIQSLIVLASQKTSVHHAPSDLTLVYAKHLPLYFQSNPFEKTVLSIQQIKSLTRKFTNQQSVYNPFPLSEYFNIDVNDLTPGCICEVCYSPLRRLSERKWLCKGCGNITKFATKRAVYEYFAVFDRELSRKKCKEFFGVENNPAKHILKNLPLQLSGNGKSVLYHIEERILSKELLSRQPESNPQSVPAPAE
ncbi:MULTISPECIES: nuclease-related domain-containing protein [unclassified Sporosarcina]|uniref:nuclease-related domain-containing protein n=1 Tax=unclassified Sporosarcina TaxID=2647733 RepID=UPI00204249CF|nr:MULTISPECIES: nuclease-related domain-containing protein [unclassified Sporosarcina]